MRSSHCKPTASRRDTAGSGTSQPEVSGLLATPPLTSSSPSLAPPPDMREVLLLPRAEDDWKKANEHFATMLMPLVVNASGPRSCSIKETSAPQSGAEALEES